MAPPTTYSNARIFFAILLLPFFISGIGRLIGSWVRSRTKERRELLLERSAKAGKEQTGSSLEQPLKKDSSSADISSDWQTVNAGDRTPPQQSSTFPNSASATNKAGDEGFAGIIAFFHPFANAGGGGERVLFAAIQATQQRYPSALCVVYTGDHEVLKSQMLENARNRFNITLNSAKVEFLYLSMCDWVLASMWPIFTLLGQSIGSLILGWEALNLVVPDVLVDTMGYAFVLGFAKWLFPGLPTGAYVHYPTISTDMLASLKDVEPGRGVNAGAGKRVKGMVKTVYWHVFAYLYGWVGRNIDVVMTNSTWTQRHITSLWSNKSTIVYPPCAVKELHEKISLNADSEKGRTRDLIFISQFRPEKNHPLILSAFAKYLKDRPLTPTQPTPRLILAGSVRDDQDEKYVYKLRLQAAEPPLKGQVEFVVNAKWEKLRELLGKCSVGVNGMWNEHFGIGVVEYQAAGLVAVVHGSGGPKEDIVVEVEGEATGFHAETAEEFAKAFEKALSLSEEEALAMRLRARKNSLRFSEEVFGEAWNKSLDRLVEMSRSRAK